MCSIVFLVGMTFSLPRLVLRYFYVVIRGCWWFSVCLVVFDGLFIILKGFDGYFEWLSGFLEFIGSRRRSLEQQQKNARKPRQKVFEVDRLCVSVHHLSAPNQWKSSTASTKSSTTSTRNKATRFPSWICIRTLEKI